MARNDAVDFDQEIQTLLCKVPGTELSVILNRKAVPQAVEKYMETLSGILDALKKKADYIILDTAPISLVSDAEELAVLADTSIIVIRQHWIEAREINDTIDALGGRKRMLGCVFNNARKTSLTGSAAGYGYGYGGQYAE
jgi:Mrp family chromosome partitioning ATPase